ncbi:hypothetical protein HZS_4891 [Henneguya salminicola]|nr:hypothetical protein HZS_4891 [Henneguya salminicola]
MSCCTKDLQLTDVVDIVPDKEVIVTYGVHKVDHGKELTPTQVKEKPHVTWDAEEGKLYTLIMTDPDAPSRNDPKYREWFHWVVVNIPGNDVSKGEECYGYIGAAPPHGTGLHRYIFLVFEQPGHIPAKEKKHSSTDTSDRPNQKSMAISKKYSLGHPKFINVFQAKYDDYVPKLYQKLH